MPMPGASDAYFYEWYVGLENVIKMLNPDSGIRCVIFQHDKYNTIDDVVVEYTNGTVQMCYQVKHNIETAAPKSLTFGSMLESSGNKKCLFEAMFQGWKQACSISSNTLIKPVLFTNRVIHDRCSGRCINGKAYSAYAVDQFVEKMQNVIAETEAGANIVFSDETLECQWEELCSVLDGVNPNDLTLFLKEFQIRGNERSLKDLKRSLLSELCDAFSCESSVALELFGRLLNGLTDWTATGREKREVTAEDVKSVLAIGEDVDESQHRLAYPYPFFDSRRSFCEEWVKQIEETSQKVVFISGDPGSGKTSTISFLQSEYNLFLLRYHTFRPISPEQHFYNADPGACTVENLWGTLLIQLRKRLKGHLDEHQVPVSNKLLSIEEMRSHVMRLLGILGQEAIAAGRREYICIDGIDHAARANIPVTFLTSLPLPSEIPDGICFILAGQPVTMYQDQYPQWLSNDTGIENISMPNLVVSDIKQLIFAHADQFTDVADELSAYIFEKTTGNNLSTVFAIEEIKTIGTLEDAVAKLEQSCIGEDIQQYYNHIWAFMKAELSKIIGGTVFPESIVACPILLMNGRVNTRILASALNYGLSQLDWTMLLDRLFPLVIRTDDGEYALFHNDFRVFLMGVIHSYQARYEEIALSLAQYFLEINEGILSYTMGIPLLQCAQKSELVPQYFTTKFVINALAEGVSYTRLDEFAHLSYAEACKNRDYIGYRNTYLAIKTLHQHKRYFEYYQKEYKASDYPEISTIDLAEVRVLPIRKETLDDYSNVLSLCEKLYSSDRVDFKERALRLYHKWFCDYSPVSFVPLCADSLSEEDAWKLRSTETGLFLQQWGTVAAKLNIPAPDIGEEWSTRDRYAVLSFGEQYFSSCIQQQKYDQAINIIKAGYVSQKSFCEKLDDIYYAGAASYFSDILTKVKQSDENPTWNLLAQSMKVTCDPSFLPDPSVLKTAPPVEHISDQSIFTLVLKAFLLGCSEKTIDDETLVSHSDEYCATIEGSKTGKGQATFLARMSVLLGKYYWTNDFHSDKFEGYSEWLLSASLSRSMDYSTARRFLLHTLLKSNAVQSIGGTEGFIAALQESLFHIDSLGMFYKTCILDYLVEQKRFDIIKQYINDLYGNNCSNISSEELKADTHEHFRPYGKLVEPELMQQFSEQLKWDVVGYLGYKEYALKAPLDCFEQIVKNNPSRWKDLGAQLYDQSTIADHYSNHYSYEIENCITEAAAVSGITDYWELRKWNEEFRLKPAQINDSLLGFIKNASSQKELNAIWILCCGINSWYTQSERSEVANVYDACINRAREIDIDFSAYVALVTPEWKSIVMFLSDQSSDLDEIVTSNSRSAERDAVSAFHNGLSVDESLDFLNTVEQSRRVTDHFIAVLEKALSDEENVQEHLKQFLCIFGVYLRGKDWVYERLDQIMIPLLSLFGWDAFWAFADSNVTQLSNYDYEISSRNMQYLFNLMCRENLAEMELLFKEELQTQRTWVSGDNHFNIENDCESPVIIFTNTPQSFAELALYILLEQANTKNARKLEAAVYAIYLLGVQFPEIIPTVMGQWKSLSDAQKECILFVFVRWVAEEICLGELHDFLLNMYTDCSELPQKIYLHSILLHLHETSVEAGVVSCMAPAIDFEIPEDGIADRDNCFRFFLSMVERYKGKTEVDAIRKCLYEAAPLENFVEDRFANDGDNFIPEISIYPGKIFYSIEKRGDWSLIPLKYKKAYLIPPEDPFLLTEMPHMVFDSKWFPDITVGSHDRGKDSELTTSDLHHIAHSHVNDYEIVLAASLWYPFGYKEGTIYMESSKIDIPIKMQRSNQFDMGIGNYGLLISEEAIVESFDSTIGTGGISLFNRLCGFFRLCYGNCQLVPSSIWRDFFDCKPKRSNPYIWEDHSGMEVLRFERIASPIRELIQEAYIRQPILFRWICNKTWLSTILQNEGLCLIPSCIQEPYPFGEDK